METVAPQSPDTALDNLFAKASSIGQPLDGTFELTSQCNLKCGMCYIRTDTHDDRTRNDELSASEWVKLGKSAVEAGMVFLLLTGGEALVRPDFFDIYDPMTDMGIDLSIYSNGTLITPEIAARFAARPPHSIGITMYGATASTYETVTGTRGSFSQCCAGIDALLNAGVKSVILKTTLTRHNVHEYGDIQALAKQWGVPFMPSWLLMRRPNDCQSSIDEFRLSAGECVSLETRATETLALPDNSVHSRNAATAQGPLRCHAGCLKSALLYRYYGCVCRIPL